MTLRADGPFNFEFPTIADPLSELISKTFFST